MKKGRIKKLLAALFALTMVATSVPSAFFSTASAAESGTNTRIADNTTLDSWQQYFGTDDRNFTTQYSGHVWTDKSVTTDASEFGYATELADRGDKITIDSEDQNNFLVSLSAMASSKSITGQDNKPTDTMIVLDLSSSMYRGTDMDPATVKTMLTSVNNTIAQLQALNVHNRVGVTIYFGQNSYWQSKSSNYKLMLPLDRYTHSSNTFLKTNVNGSKLESVQVNSNVKNSAGTTVAVNKHTCPSIAGTYAQLGLLSAMNQFLAADTVVPMTAATQAGEARTPVFVFMSDGKPTASTNNYTKIEDAKWGCNTENYRNPEESDFVNQLTAAYVKARVDVHYEKEEPLFYSLSLGNGISYDVMDPADTLEKSASDGSSSSEISAYWDKLLSDGSVRLTVSNTTTEWPVNGNVSFKNYNFTVSKTTVDGKSFPSSKSQQLYVDKAFEAATAGDLADAFASIFTDISLQTHTYPTLVDGDENLDGYISFVDKIGEYMSVTDVKGILLGETWYSGKEFAKNLSTLGDMTDPTPLGNELVWSIQQRLGLSDTATVRTLLSLAYQHGQLAYNSDGSYSNYVGWYSDAQGNYLGFWQDGVTTVPDNATHMNKSYMYLGETDDANGVADSDMMYTTVRIRYEIETGVESVSFAVPAALIPTVEYDVEYDENDQLTAVTRGGADNPIRLIYEVALDDSINEYTIRDAVDHQYIAHNTDEDGYVNFYTNQYEVTGEVGYGKVNTYSYFRPSHQNENYYYQGNEPVYTDQAGTVYKSDNAPDTNGVYYREITVYSNDNGTIKEQNIYRQLSSAALDSAVPKADGTWYIPKGNVHVNMDGYTIAKTENKTQTLANVNLPYVDVYGHNVNDTDHRFVIGDTLGNNGKVKIKAETGIKLTKVIANADSETNMDEEFEFTIATAESVTGVHDAVKIAADGTEAETTVNFNSGKVTVNLKHGESMYVLGLAPGLEFTVTETEEANFVVSKVVMDGYTISETVAKGTLGDGYIADVEFTNVPRGEGALTIAKQVVHSLGDYYQITDDKTFIVNVKLEGVAVSSGDKFEMNHSGNGDLKEITLGRDNSFELTLKNGEQVEIKGVPEGTRATVTEADPGIGFTASYKENGSAGDGVIESIQKAPTIDNVTVVNTYNPEPIDVTIGGSKQLSGRDLSAEEFKFELKDSNGDVIETVANDADGEFEFSKLTYDKAGTYEYTVSEIAGSLANIEYDENVFTVKVIISDNGDGTLTSEVYRNINDEAISNIQFYNTYIPDPAMIALEASKQLTGRDWADGEEFTFKLEAEGDTKQAVTNGTVVMPAATATANSEVKNVKFGEIKFTKAGIYNFVISEIAGNADGMTYDTHKLHAIVTVTDDGNGKLSAVAAYAGSTTFENKFTPEPVTVTLNGTKELIGRDLAEGEFSFEIAAITKDAPMPAVSSVKNTEDGKISFGAITFTEIGTYEYKITEVIPVDKKIPGVTYDSNVVTAIVKVTQSSEADNFGNMVAEVSYKKSGADPEDSFTFNNEYKAKPVTHVIEATKSVKISEGNNYKLKADQFSFTIAGRAGAPMPEKTTVYNDADGKVKFDEIKFEMPGTYVYTVTENSGSIGGMSYDSAVYTITVDVTDNSSTGKLEKAVKIEKGQTNGTVEEIEFINIYDPEETSVVISGNKMMSEDSHKVLEAGEFTFAIEAKTDNAPMPEKTMTTNTAAGLFQFDKITYDKPGIYEYVVYEKNDGNVGYTYDGTRYTVIVEIKDEAGKLVPHVDGLYDSSGEPEIVFTNKYIPEPVTIVLGAEKELNKILEGRELKDGEFQFALINGEGNNVSEAVNNKEGNFQFTLDFDKAGVYRYSIIEVYNNISGVTYDTETVYDVEVEIVDDNGKLKLNGSPKYTLNSNAVEEVVFNNTYIPAPTEIQLGAVKTLEGRSLEAGEFTFQLEDESGNVMTAVNGENGEIEFDRIVFEETGTYTYTMTEKAGKDKDITYDETAYQITVEVIDDLNGNLEAKIVGDSVKVPVFKNIYNPPGSGSDDDSSKTGDDMNILLIGYIGIMALLIGIMVAFAGRRRVQ